LAEKELILLQKEQELLDKEQTLLVLKEEVRRRAVGVGGGGGDVVGPGAEGRVKKAGREKGAARR
jgi:hypothetical protein